MREDLRELWQHRELTLSFARRDIKARYRQTAFGAAWAVLQPFSLMVVFTLVFSRFAKISTDGIPYPVFSYTSLIFWTFFANSVSHGTVAMVANASLVRKIYFPREALLIAVILSAALDLCIATTIFGGMLAYFRVGITATVLWVPVLLLLQTIFALGISCLSSALHVNYRDVGHALPLLLQLWLFATPVAYPLSLVPEPLLPLYLLNPMAPIIEGYRRVILRGVPPDPQQLMLATVIILTITCAGYVLFKRAERTFADVI